MTGRDHGAPQVSWWGATAPTTVNTGTSSTWVGVEFEVTQPGRVFGFRAWMIAGGVGPPVAYLWVANGIFLCAKGFKDVSYPAGFAQTWVHPTVRLVPSTLYRVAILYVGGHFSRTASALAGGNVTHGHITFAQSFQSTSLTPFNGTPTFNTNANAVDILWQPD